MSRRRFRNIAFDQFERAVCTDYLHCSHAGHRDLRFLDYCSPNRVSRLNCSTRICRLDDRTLLAWKRPSTKRFIKAHCGFRSNLIGIPALGAAGWPHDRKMPHFVALSDGAQALEVPYSAVML
jgi:hypothetical protein